MSRSVRDRLLPISGGSDRWDRGPAGAIIKAEFFGLQEGPPPPGGGMLMVWSGTAWQSCPCKVWTGSGWVVKPCKVWNGSSWRAELSGNRD